MLTKSGSKSIHRNVGPETGEDIEDLTMRGTNSLRWVTQHLQQFSVIRAAGAEPFGVKALGELAMLYLYLKCVSAREGFHHSSLPRFLTIWEEFLRHECQDPAYAELARKQLAEGFDALIPYLMLRATGYRDDYHEETLTRLRRIGFPEATSRGMSTNYFLWKSGLVSEEPDWIGLYNQTFLARVRSRIYINDFDAYSITHDVMYLTDFGLRPLPLDAAEAARMIDIIECLTVAYWRKGHWDLLGELLMNLVVLGGRDSPVYLGAKQALDAVWRDDGAIPAWSAQQTTESTDAIASAEPESPQSDSQGRVEMEARSIGEDEISEFFKLHYHTTLVGILYCTASLLHSGVE